VLERFVDDDIGYRSWLAAHPDGYVLDCGRRPTRSFLVVHRARCPLLQDLAPPQGSLTGRTAKVVANAAAELDLWARDQTGGYASRCVRCFAPAPSAGDPDDVMTG
jgi:hypothetical protein